MWCYAHSLRHQFKGENYSKTMNRYSQRKLETHPNQKHVYFLGPYKSNSLTSGHEQRSARRSSFSWSLSSSSPPTVSLIRVWPPPPTTLVMSVYIRSWIPPYQIGPYKSNFLTTRRRLMLGGGAIFLPLWLQFLQAVVKEPSEKKWQVKSKFLITKFLLLNFLLNVLSC